MHTLREYRDGTHTLSKRIILRSTALYDTVNYTTQSSVAGREIRPVEPIAGIARTESEGLKGKNKIKIPNKKIK
jgi:hypothetical protein